MKCGSAPERIPILSMYVLNLCWVVPPGFTWQWNVGGRRAARLLGILVSNKTKQIVDMRFLWHA